MDLHRMATGDQVEKAVGERQRWSVVVEQ